MVTETFPNLYVTASIQFKSVSLNKNNFLSRSKGQHFFSYLDTA